jgi:dihydrofolate reductase
MPWGRTLKSDLRMFQRLTRGKTVIMGRKTFTDDIKKALPGRLNIVISRNPAYPADGCLIADSLDHAIRISQGEAFVIGGAEIFRRALFLARKIYLTRVEASFDAGSKGVYLDLPDDFNYEWELVGRTVFPADEENKYRFTACVYSRRANA